MKLSLRPEDNDTSVTLDLIRFLAALAVLFGHGISYFGVASNLQAPYAPYMQNVGVLVFFCLSGFLIAFVLDRARSTGGGFGSYLIDRFARIYSGLVPSMILIGAIDLWMVSQSLHGHPQYATAGYWLGNMAMLNGYLDIFSPLMLIPNFGSAGQLWTLAVEVHLYVFVGALFFAASRFFDVRPLLVALVFSVVPIAYLSSEREPGAGITWLWVLGFASFHLLKSFTGKLPPLGLLLGMAAVTALLFKVMVPGQEYDGLVYLLLAVDFVLLVMLTQQSRVFSHAPKIRSLVRYCADFSFTLYLLHHTLVYATYQLMPSSGWIGFWLSVSVSLLLSVVIAHIGEKNHKALATKLKTYWRSRLRTVDRQVG